MSEKRTYHLWFAGHFFALFILVTCTISASAQLSKSIYKTSLLEDTLVASGNRDFLYNTINITNLTTDKISVLVNIKAPEGWDIITQKVITISLDANGNTSIPIRLVASKSKTAQWQTVKIEYRLNEGLEKLTDTFRVRVREFTKFKAYLPLSNFVKAGYEKNLAFPLYLKNQGNTPNNYTVYYYNAFLQLDYKTTFSLPPGADTTYNIPLRISERQWSSLRKEEIKVQVSVENGETMNMTQEFSRLGNTLKDHSSAFLDMPLQAETGFTYQGAENFQYYAALHGSVDLTTQDRLAFDLRSKTLSKGQATDNSVLRGEYTGEHWSASAGNINELTDFYMDGYGAKVGYHQFQQRDKIDVYGLLSSRTGNSKLGGINYAYGGIADYIRLIGGATVNFDIDRKLNSYLLKQGAEIRFGTTGKLNLNAGTGMEQTTAQLVANTKNSQLGTSLGYNLQWSNKVFNVNSIVAYNSNSYPGIFKGQRLQSHDLRLSYKALFVGGFYEYNLRKQNFYQDTTLFSNVFNLKSQNYGSRVGVGFKGSNLILSAGKQLQVQSDTGQYAKYLFSYLNLNLSALFFKHLYLTVNSYYGNGQIPGMEDTTTVTVNSNQGALQYKWIGASFRYDKGPYYYHEYIAYIHNREPYERIIFSPFAEVNLFKHALNIRAQFNYAKTIPGNIETSNILANLNYANYKHGFDLSIIGLIPVKQLVMTPYISASLRVRLTAPFVAVKRYQTLRIQLFKDNNNDGEKNDGEEVIGGQMMSVNGNLFVTDDNGIIIFRNIEKAEYKADFGYGSKIKGWIPSNGPVQLFTLKRSQTFYVPYKKSKVLLGQLRLMIDSFSNLSFKLGNIKVMAESIDSKDTLKYSTITGENGDFYFNLPGGSYNITLSQLAFDENFRPTQYTQPADLTVNDTKTIYFDIKQRKRAINIKKKD